MSALKGTRRNSSHGIIVQTLSMSCGVEQSALTYSLTGLTKIVYNV